MIAASRSSLPEVGGIGKVLGKMARSVLFVQALQHLPCGAQSPPVGDAQMESKGLDRYRSRGFKGNAPRNGTYFRKRFAVHKSRPDGNTVSALPSAIAPESGPRAAWQKGTRTVSLLARIAEFSGQAWAARARRMRARHRRREEEGGGRRPEDWRGCVDLRRGELRWE